MFKHEYDQLIREHFDLTDSYTRKFIVSLTEDAQQDQLLTALSSALYDKIVSKVDEIDFGSIPLSRGDITKVEGFVSTEKCLDIIRNLVIEYKQNPTIVDVVISAVNNIKERKALFIKAYALNSELPMLIYNTTVLAIERSVSLLIATCIDYVKDPTSNNIETSLNKAAYNKTMDDLLFKQLINFNNMCHNGQFDKTMEAVMKNNVRAAREEVEMMYKSISAIDGEDPTSPETPQDADDNPFDPESTIEPFGNRVSEEEEPTTGDTEIPAPNEFPEEVPDSEPMDPVDIEGPEDDEPEETPFTTASDDEVEPDNIPTVNPGDDVVASDTPINELEDEDENDETDNGTPFEPEVYDTENNPVDEVGLISALGIGTGVAVASIFGAKFAGFLIKTVIATLRSIVYYFYYSRMKFSDYLEIQADLIEANANELQYSTTSDLSDKEKDKVVKKQVKLAQKFRKWANIFAIDSKAASNKASKNAQDDDRNKNKIRPNDDGDDSIF